MSSSQSTGHAQEEPADPPACMTGSHSTPRVNRRIFCIGGSRNRCGASHRLVAKLVIQALQQVPIPLEDSLLASLREQNPHADCAFVRVILHRQLDAILSTSPPLCARVVKSSMTVASPRDDSG